MPATPIDYLIVGGAAAGMAAAQAIRENDTQGQIAILSEETDQPYFRPLIPFLISGKKDAADMAMAGQGPYTAQGIDIRLDSRVVKVDTTARTVSTADGDQVPYGKLLIATGSRPYIPETIDGTDTEGVFALRTLADAREAAKRATHAEHAIMLGGGLLNLKAAFALLERGIKVTLVVYSPEVLSQLMEPDDALLLRQALDNAGLQIQTGRSAVEIVADRQGVKGVRLDDDQVLDCHMALIGKGVRPNVHFLHDSDLELDQGVVVDRFTRCNQENVYAAGDVAVTFDPITGDRMMTGLWTNAVEMGRCAGFNMAGRTTEYAGTFGILNATQVANQPFVSMGIVHTAGTDLEVHTQARSDTYRKLVFSAKGDRLIGAVLVGDISAAGLYRFIIRERRSVASIKKAIVDQSLHYGHLLS